MMTQALLQVIAAMPTPALLVPYLPMIFAVVFALAVEYGLVWGERSVRVNSWGIFGNLLCAALLFVWNSWGGENPEEYLFLLDSPGAQGSGLRFQLIAFVAVTVVAPLFMFAACIRGAIMEVRRSGPFLMALRILPALPIPYFMTMVLMSVWKVTNGFSFKLFY